MCTDERCAERVCAAIIRDGRILMVRHTHGARDYWTLPGGGVESGETLEAAIIREVREEVKLSSAVVRLLCRREYVSREGRRVGESCFLMRVDGTDDAALGNDPELDAGSQILQDVGWFCMDELCDDIQVSRVLRALGLTGEC